MSTLNESYIIKEDGLDIKIKPIPNDNRKGALDPKVLERIKNKMQSAAQTKDTEQEQRIEDIPLEEFRSQMGSKNIDITKTDVSVAHRLINLGDHYISICIYNKKDGLKNKSAVIFFHGGGFFGGSVKTLGNQCKLLAEKSGAVVISTEYRLAPENPFPCGVEDCMNTVKWVYDNHGLLEIDKNKIAVAGESAGANFAAVCALNDRRKIIKLLITIYAALDLNEAEETFYNWNYNLYDMLEEHKKYIIARLNRFKKLNTISSKLYIQNGVSVNNPDVSPIFSKNLEELPQTVIIEGEFDFFRISNDIFAKKIQESGVDVEVIRYLGMDHGFYDRIGTCLQTEDCIIEMAKAIKEKL